MVDENDSPAENGQGRLSARFKSFVETCGRHPFATGLFALIGLFGLLFSFLQFGLDQVQASEDRLLAEATSQDLSDVEDGVESLRRSTTDSDSSAVPVRVDFGVWTDHFPSVSFAANHMSDYRSVSPVGHILTTDPASFGHTPFMAGTITSTLNQDYVQVAPYFLAEVNQVNSITGDLASRADGEFGDGGVLYYATLALPPEAGLYVAPLVDNLGVLPEEQNLPRTDIQYFKLAPKEPEEFFLTVHLTPGYVYELRLGIQYRYDGVDRINWFTPRFRAGLPNSPHPVSSFGEEYEVRLHPHLEYELMESEIRALNQRFVSFVGQQRLFRPDMVHQD